MTATEKRKYISAKLLEMLAPYGYFSRHKSVWRYSFDGKYVIRISFDLTSWGGLHRLEIAFGSFYGPIERNPFISKEISLEESLELDYYLRNTGSPSVFWDSQAILRPFEETVEAILPHFRRIVLPNLPISDDLGEYLPKAEKLLQLRADAHYGIPSSIGIKSQAFAYLSLQQPEEALRVVSHYADQCRHASDFIGRHVEIFKYDIDKRVDHWMQMYEETQALGRAIEADGGKAFEAEIRQREETSAAFCKAFFHHPK